ncbi:MAG: ABC-type transport auxiliary lipoprotein family protein [Luteimonas sp.]
MESRSWRLASVLVPMLLAGCSILGGSKEPVTVYAPDPRVAPDASWPRVTWQLEIARPDAARSVDSMRIAVRPTPDELQVYKGASWAKTPSEQLQAAVQRTLEDSGKIDAVAAKGSGVAADYTLLMDLRRYESDYAGNALPTATIEVNAKLLHAPDQTIVASHTFRQANPSVATDAASVAAAFGTALGTVGHDIAGWVLRTGDEHERTHPQG